MVTGLPRYRRVLESQGRGGCACFGDKGSLGCGCPRHSGQVSKHRFQGTMSRDRNINWPQIVSIMSERVACVHVFLSVLQPQVSSTQSSSLMKSEGTSYDLNRLALLHDVHDLRQQVCHKAGIQRRPRPFKALASCLVLSEAIPLYFGGVVSELRVYSNPPPLPKPSLPEDSYLKAPAVGLQS